MKYSIKDDSHDRPLTRRDVRVHNAYKLREAGLAAHPAGSETGSEFHRRVMKFAFPAIRRTLEKDGDDKALEEAVRDDLQAYLQTSWDGAKAPDLSDPVTRIATLMRTSPEVARQYLEKQPAPRPPGTVTKLAGKKKGSAKPQT